MKNLIALLAAGLIMAGCASTTADTESSQAPAAKQQKNTCAVDADCGEGNICVKPEAADYGFCL